MSVEKMTDEEIDDVLQRHSIGILSLSKSNISYGVPESFGYRDGVLYFYFIHHDESRKMNFVESSETATLTIYDDETLESVIVHGELEEVEAKKSLVGGSIFAEQTAFPTLEFNIELGDQEYENSFYKMEIELATGRQFTPKLE